MPDRRPTGRATAVLATATGTEDVRVELDRFTWTLADVLHALACASREPVPGRTLRRHVAWRVR